MNSIIGHSKILDLFDKIKENNNLSHAYCFVGPEKLGKRTVAQTLSAQFLGTELDKLGAHPDVMLVSQEMNQKTDKTKKNIDVDQIRSLRSILQTRPLMGEYKIAIVDEAEKMSLGASNALLKTLEEPKDQTIIFLITKDEKLLPVTIQSRCQMIYFHSVERKVIKDFLCKKNVDKDRAEEMARFSRGLPGLALSWLADPESQDVYLQEVKRFISMTGKPFFEKLKLIDNLFGDKSDHIQSRSRLVEVLHVWQLLLRDIAYDLQGQNQQSIHNLGSVSKWTNQQVLEVESRLVKAKKLLEKNIHPKLLVEQILLQIP